MAGKTVKQLYGNGMGQSFMDRMNAAKYSVTGSELAKVVCKATTEEMSAPKKKHMDYLVQCTFEPNVSIPELANHLISRTQQSNWVIVFKALITIHNTMNYGNERFSQYLSTNNCQMTLSAFSDRTGVQAFDMSKFVRQYSRYVEQKTKSYRDMGFDFCKIKRGKEHGILRKMSADKLMKSIPVLEIQLDSMLDFDANGSEIHHPIVYGAFMLLYKDSIRLFATYNDGMINLIEKYFSMNKKQCREALGIYRHFTKRMDRVNKFLRLAEEIGCGDKDGLELLPVPPSVLEALESHLKQIDGTSCSENTASSSYNAATNSETRNTQSELRDHERQTIIDEEKAKLDEFAAKRSQNAMMSTAMSEPFLNKFDCQPLSHAQVGQSAKKPNNDLISLGLDPDPQTVAYNNISTEVADIFGVSVNCSQKIPTPMNDPFAFNSSFVLPSKSVIYREINFDTAFSGNSKLLCKEIDRISVCDVDDDTFPVPNKALGHTSDLPVSLDAKLASLANSLDIAGRGGRFPQSCSTSVNWSNSARPMFEHAPMKSNTANRDTTRGSGTTRTPVQTVGGGAPKMAMMQSMPALYNQNVQGHMAMQYPQNGYGMYYGGYGQQASAQYPAHSSGNMHSVPFQPSSAYSDHASAQFWNS